MTHFAVIVILPKRSMLYSSLKNVIDSMILEYSEYNDNASETFYDWYVIGGRFSGMIVGQTSDVIKVKDVKFPPNYWEKTDIPNHVVTPDGKYHNQNLMGWWAMKEDKVASDKWRLFWEELKQKYADHTAVLLDCHV